MRTVPERSPAAQIMVVLGGFLVGPLASHAAASSLAPGSELVQTIAVFAFILTFVFGAMIWMGLGVAAVVFRALWSLVRGRLPRPATSRGAERLVPPGYRSFVFLGGASGAGVGLLAGLATDPGVLSAVFVWGGLGLCYGLGLWAAAHHGYLPFPEPE